jgi:hypothetical protein
LTIGNTYCVVLDDQEYECVCKKDFLWGTEYTLLENEYFYLLELNPGTWCFEFNGSPYSRMATIYEVNVLITHLHEKFIPDTIARVTDIQEIHTWESLPDKPFERMVYKN